MLEEKLDAITVVSVPEEKLMDWVSSAVVDPEGSITTCWDPD